MEDAPDAIPAAHAPSACVSVGGGIVVCTEIPFLSAALALVLYIMLKVIRRAMCPGDQALDRARAQESYPGEAFRAEHSYLESQTGKGYWGPPGLDRASRRLNGKEAVRQFDSDDCGGSGFFKHPRSVHHSRV